MAEMFAVAQAGSTDSGLAARTAGEVRAWAGRLGLSQKDLARILGVSQAQMSARMRGRMEFSLSEIEKLAQAWGIDYLELLAPVRHTRREGGRDWVNNAQSRRVRTRTGAAAQRRRRKHASGVTTGHTMTLTALSA